MVKYGEFRLKNNIRNPSGMANLAGGISWTVEIRLAVFSKRARQLINALGRNASPLGNSCICYQIVSVTKLRDPRS